MADRFRQPSAGKQRQGKKAMANQAEGGAQGTGAPDRKTAIGRAREATGIEPDLMSTAEVSAWLGLSREMIRRLTKTDGFPKPLEIAPRVRRYRRDLVWAWVLEKTPPAKTGK